MALVFTVPETAFAVNPNSNSKFYFNESGQLVGQSLLTCTPQETHAGNVHTAYYVTVSVSCGRPTPAPPTKGPEPICIPHGSLTCYCWNLGSSGWECQNVHVPSVSDDTSPIPMTFPPPLTGQPGSPGYVNPDLLPPCGNSCGGGGSGGGSGGSDWGPVAGAYVSDYVLPSSLTIQEACALIKECDAMPTPITYLGWTWEGGWQ